MKELTLVIPIYNEQEIIQHVIQDWTNKLESLDIDFQICAYNDGSKDESLQKLQEIQTKNPALTVIDKPNSGHGPTILQGYREAETAWVFQIDSDNEMKPDQFHSLWDNRNDYDLLIGIRENHEQLLTRKIISAISRITVNMFYGRGVSDVNSPYRLMRRKIFQKIYRSIPDDTFAPNIIISGMASKKELRIFETNIPIKVRTTGEVSIKKWRLLKAAVKSWWQTVLFAIRTDVNKKNTPETEV